jgi:hypothetical protein
MGLPPNCPVIMDDHDLVTLSIEAHGDEKGIPHFKTHEHIEHEDPFLNWDI